MRTKGKDGGLDGQYLIHTAYRFRDAFLDPDKAMGLFKQVPFLNGGLFECLDREVSARDLERNSELEKRWLRKVPTMSSGSMAFERPENR